MYNNIDYESLRRDLINYFGSAMSIYPIALMDVTNVEQASDYEIIEIAINNGFNLSDYEQVIRIKWKVSKNE